MESDKTDIDLEELFEKVFNLWTNSKYKGGLAEYLNELDIGVRFDESFASKYTLIVVDWQKFLLGKIKYGI